MQMNDTISVKGTSVTSYNSYFCITSSFFPAIQWTLQIVKRRETLQEFWVSKVDVRKLLHSKNRRCSTEPPKRFRKSIKASKWGLKSQKKYKKIYETFKCSSRVSRGRTFSCETFFKGTPRLFFGEFLGKNFLFLCAVDRPSVSISIALWMTSVEPAVHFLSNEPRKIVVKKIFFWKQSFMCSADSAWKVVHKNVEKKSDRSQTYFSFFSRIWFSDKPHGCAQHNPSLISFDRAEIFYHRYFGVSSRGKIGRFRFWCFYADL